MGTCYFYIFILHCYFILTLNLIEKEFLLEQLFTNIHHSICTISSNFKMFHILHKREIYALKGAKLVILNGLVIDTVSLR